MIAEINLPEKVENYIQIRGGEVFVDWNKLGNLKRKVSYGDIDLETFNSRFDNVLEYLLDQGVLTFDRDNSWRIVLDMDKSDFGPKPSYGQDRMNFTREEDAKGYLEAFHKYTQYSVGIEKLVA